MKPKIGIDVDGVLRDIASQIVCVFEREYANLATQYLPISKWPDWNNFKDYFPSEVNFYEFIRNNFNEIWLGAPQYDSASYVYNTLNDYYDLHIVTAQPTTKAAKSTIAWLKNNKFNVEESKIHILTDKRLAPVDILVDDAVHNLENVESANIIPICMTRPWNVQWKGNRIFHIKDLLDIFLAVNKI